MVGYYYKTGANIYSILRFMKNSLDLPYKPSAGSIEVIKMYADKRYRFSFFLNERKEIIYLIEQLGDDTTDYSKEEKKMTKEEALKKIEELKAFVEKLDEEIPEMPCDENGTHRLCLMRPACGAWEVYDKFQFKSLDTRECYRIKAFELAHLMYAREHLGFKTKYFCYYRLYFDSDKLKYDVVEFDRYNNYSSDGIFESINHWLFPDEDSARKVANYMNKYVADKVKELY